MSLRESTTHNPMAQPFSRRNFVKLAALAAVPLPRILVSAAEAASRRDGDRILVMLQLSGGNDGLNSVVPCEDSLYYKSRPTLALGRNQVLRLEKGGPLGFHPDMTALHKLYRDGVVTVIQGVGYPNPNRSHFRSMEIWHTARPAEKDVTYGWLGRAIAGNGLEALGVGDSKTPLALVAPGIQVPVLQNLNWLDTLFSAKGTELRGMLKTLLDRRRSGDLEFLRGASSSTFTQLEKLENIRNKPLPVKYPYSSIAKRLKWTGQMIASGVASRIYYVSMGGYDTHAQQGGLHAQLMRQFSDGVSAFYKHMEKVGMADRVVLVAFSEFGRRVKENGSQGTDHGVAAPMWVVSGKCKGGLIGDPPDLANLTGGDVRHTIDFRRVYTTVLDEVLGIDPREVVGGEFEKLPLFAKRRTATF